MKQFLVIQTAFLGDAVLATALLEKLHARYPDASIDLVVRKGNEGLFGGTLPSSGQDRLRPSHDHPFLRRVFVWDKRSNKTRNLIKLIRALRYQRYDHIINCQRFFSTGLMMVLARGTEKVGYDKNPLSFLFTRKVKHEIPDPVTLRPGMRREVQRDNARTSGLTNPDVMLSPSKHDPTTVHEVDRLNALIAHLTDDARPLPALYPTAVDREATDAWVNGPPYVTVAPASVWHTKQWPAEKWIALIKALPMDRRVLLIGAPVDIPLCERIAREAGRGDVLAGKLSLLGTAHLMESAAMNYVNDSAPLHIASAMNAPVTAVFCSTVPAFGFGPLNANGRVVELEKPLYCRPCGLHGYKACPEGHFKCATGIRVDDAAS